MQFYKFYFLRLFKNSIFLSIVISLLCFSILVTLVLYINQFQAMQYVKDSQRLLTEKNRPTIESSRSAGSLRKIFPTFNSIQLVKELTHIADDVKLPLDEIGFSLEDNVREPYIRYRATLSVSSNYQVIRHFIARSHTDIPNVSLDSISCARENIGVPALNCDLVFSAFYRKDVRGG